MSALKNIFTAMCFVLPAARVTSARYTSASAPFPKIVDDRAQSIRTFGEIASRCEKVICDTPLSSFRARRRRRRCARAAPEASTPTATMARMTGREMLVVSSSATPFAPLGDNERCS